MSYNYTPLNQTATRLITTFGRDVTFTRQTQDAYNPATGVTSNTSSTYTKKCVIGQFDDAQIGSSKSGQPKRAVMAGTRISANAESGDYLVDDVATIDGEQFRVISVTQVNPAGTQVYFVLEMQK